jgi:hypothetical protein
MTLSNPASLTRCSDSIRFSSRSWSRSRTRTGSAYELMSSCHGQKCTIYALCSPCSGEPPVEDAYHCGPEEVIGEGVVACQGDHVGFVGHTVTDKLPPGWAQASNCSSKNDPLGFVLAHRCKARRAGIPSFSPTSGMPWFTSGRCSRPFSAAAGLFLPATPAEQFLCASAHKTRKPVFAPDRYWKTGYAPSICWHSLLPATSRYADPASDSRGASDREFRDIGRKSVCRKCAERMRGH